MLLSVLRHGATGFSDWSMQVAQHAANGVPEGMQAAFATLGRLTEDVGKRWVQTMDDYRFPVVTLADSTSAASVCTIFETLNRTGVQLGPFELRTARFWPLGVNLRARWQEASDYMQEIRTAQASVGTANPATDRHRKTGHHGSGGLRLVSGRRRPRSRSPVAMSCASSGARQSGRARGGGGGRGAR